MNHPFWVERYRPTDLSSYIFQSKFEEQAIRQILESEDLPNLLFAGHHGSGKTTLARILLSELNVDETDILIVNGSDEGRKIDTFRDVIRGFISGYPIGKYRVVLIEEADKLNKESVQTALRRPMEEYSDTSRFILTCNDIGGIIPPIASRCQTYTFKAPDKDSVMIQALDILRAEKIKPNGVILKQIVDAYYPDVRKIIGTLQQQSISGCLVNFTNNSGEFKVRSLELLEADKFSEIRTLLCDNISSDGDWIDYYRFLYMNLNKCQKFSDQRKWEQAIIIISDHLYKSASHADQEINMSACLIKLGAL